jgi:hypothetical protein
MTAATLFGSSGEDYLSFNAVGNDGISFSGPSYFPDLVNSPAHYTGGDIECIDAIKASLTKEAFRGYLKGCIQKYIWRYENKGNPKQDLEKAQWYINKLLSTYDTIAFS